MAQHNEVLRADAVRDMFGAIAGRYDFLNHFLSLNIDRRWRRECLREVKKRLSLPTPRILDVGCGTADLSIEFSSLGPVIGCDFCHPMLQIGARKTQRNLRGYSVQLLEGDALKLPFRDRSFDAVVSAFVLRNLASIPKGLAEMRRVIKPKGVLGILDFGLPRVPVLGRLYLYYFGRILPCIGRMVSGVAGAYKYLPDSVHSFPPAEELRSIITEAGFEDVQYRTVTAGVAVLLLGKSP